jgi:ubiquinone/menaquinone biosynthesis C-methylase UbiE
MENTTEDTSLPTPAQMYEEFYGPCIFRPLAEALVTFAPPPPGGRILDLACGTGIVARHLADLIGASGSIVAADINPAMLNIGRSRYASTAAPIEWIEADATTADFVPASFDAAYCQQGLQFFSDKLSALARLRRAIKPGGAAVIATWLPIDQHPIFAAFATVEARYLSDLGVTYDDLIARFSLGDPHELSLLLQQAGFRPVKLQRYDLRVKVTEPATFARRMETAYAAVIPAFVADPKAFASFVANVERETRGIIEQYTIDGNLLFTMPTNFVVAAAP